MFNQPRIELKLLLNADIRDGLFVIKEQVLSTQVKVYVTHENVSCYVGIVSDVRELLDIVGPQNIMETLWNCATEYEYDAITIALENSNNQYWIGDHLYTVKS